MVSGSKRHILHGEPFLLVSARNGHQNVGVSCHYNEVLNVHQNVEVPCHRNKVEGPDTLEGHGDLFHGKTGRCSLILHWEQRMRKRRVAFYPREDEVPGVEDRGLGIPRP